MTTYRQKQEEVFNKIEKANDQSDIASFVKPVADFSGDNRLCLTGVIFLPCEITYKIQEEIIAPLKKSDTEHYFYSPESLHLTIQNVRVIHDPPKFNSDAIEKAKEVFEQVVPRHTAVRFNLQGIFKAPTSIGIKGFCGEEIKELVFDLRTELKKAGIPDDKKYVSKDVIIGNTTVCRFTSKPNQEFWKKYKKIKDTETGAFDAKTVSLIKTNAGCHPGKTEIIASYQLQ
ncbi:hypothetical protein KKH43_03035 [Patescibacteria group bacterium]|nr:hypothetical protein [Patescibacteria group bacterium]